MASIDRLLAWLENRLQGLVEGGSSWLLPGGRQRRELANWLAQGMHESTRRYGDGGWQAPDLFILTLPEAAASRVDETLLLELASALKMEARRRGLVLLRQPVVRVVADPQNRAPRVQIAFADGEVGHTTTQQVMVQCSTPAGDPSHGKAYLVVDGRQTYLLTSPVVTIGRDPGSTVVLDDRRVSRAHAQLRLVQGQYVIFDLQSTGGTTVNGRLVTQHTLAPGDVIALAGVPVVYGQELPLETEITQKLPPEPGNPEVL